MLFEGVDSRWTNSYFDVFALKTVNTLLGLPSHLRPDNPERWTELGFDFEHALIRRQVISFASDHSEIWADHALQLGQCEEMRRQVEAHYGISDPLRALDRIDAGDPYAFARLIDDFVTGQVHLESLPEFFLFFFRILRVHEPVIRIYGRYPYRNPANGREFTEEEKGYMKATKGKFAVDDESAKKIRKDVLASRWTPLQGRKAWVVPLA